MADAQRFGQQVVERAPPEMVSKDVHVPKLAEVCMRQAVRLEELQAELEKARNGERLAQEALEKERKTHAQETAEYTEKVEQMSSFQAALQRENKLLLEELVSILGRTKVLNAEMAWIHQSLPRNECSSQKAFPSSPSNSQQVLPLPQHGMLSPQHALLSPPQPCAPHIGWLQGQAEASASLIHPMRRACEAKRFGPSDYHVVPAYTDIRSLQNSQFQKKTRRWIPLP
ncbi:unnamed protein product [Cladocopium goreaui]|uniref:Uncharacterized protein n=1 Tax=Cladocopium goreaui TaxID=2562237 RepID=A0A9P1C524_9DINO|nr:unnamed protein product [Cladocopium goreaui]